MMDESYGRGLQMDLCPACHNGDQYMIWKTKTWFHNERKEGRKHIMERKQMQQQREVVLFILDIVLMTGLYQNSQKKTWLSAAPMESTRTHLAGLQRSWKMEYFSFINAALNDVFFYLGVSNVFASVAQIHPYRCITS